ncbi:MAG: DNA-directed RNA polymerase subunit alpha [Treponema sp.]|nr:MAG: DNA-directed RNA polymerase subunit alpha [Treponema sp.]
MARKNLLKGFKKPRGLEFDQEVSTESYGRFTASPFEIGFGTTIGNCLRRILLSSIQGYAVSAVRINSYDKDGVQHTISSEFETIPGVTEDTIEVLNNLKQLHLSLPDEATQDTLLFEFKGPATLTGKDFAVDGRLEVFNEDIFIMQLMDDASIDMEVQVDFARGYVPAETNEKYIEIHGTIPLDAIYGPVLKVSYNIEPCRVGQRNDYDKLILEIWTDGSIKPEDALAEAAKIAKDHFTIFVNFNENELLEEEEDNEEDLALKKLLESPIKDLELTVRAKNCLDNAGIKTIAELVLKTEDEIAGMRNVGRKSLLEIQEKLHERNLRLGMTDYSHFSEKTKVYKEETDEA